MSKYQLTINSKDIKTCLNSVQLNNHFTGCDVLCQVLHKTNYLENSREAMTDVQGTVVKSKIVN